MANGRPPVPTHLKIIRGNPGGKKRLNLKEPKPIGDLTDPPAYFDEELREVWQYAIENAPKGMLKKLDSGVLEIWCDAYVRHRKASIEVRKYGMIVKSPKQELPIQSPWLPIVNRQAFIMLRAVDHLGFSPASRTRIQVGEGPGDASAWDDVAAG